MNCEQSEIKRIKNYLKEFKIKNIVFVSHNIKSEQHFYRDMSKLINLNKYNIMFINEDSKKLDGLPYKNTLGIMCGVWYKGKIKEEYYFWKLIENIVTIPIADIPTCRHYQTKKEGLI